MRAACAVRGSGSARKAQKQTAMDFWVEVEFACLAWNGSSAMGFSVEVDFLCPAWSEKGGRDFWMKAEFACNGSSAH